MDPSANTSFTVAAVPALVSTGITLLYLLLKILTYFTDATPCPSKRKEGEGTNGETRYPQQSRGMRGQGTSEVCEQEQEHSDSRGHGDRWATTTRGTVLLSGEREDILLSPKSYGKRDNELPSLQADDERLRERRDSSVPPHYGERSRGAHNDASSIHEGSVRRTNSRYGQPQNLGEYGGENEGFAIGTTAVNYYTGIPQFSEAAATANPGTLPKTIDNSAQTDNMANFIVSKDTLVAYTISVIQQTLDYHFGQMSIVYQSAHNSATHDTPSRAKQIANKHFNIALLTDQAPVRQVSNDTDNTQPPTVEPTPTTSTQETIPKSIDQGHRDPNKKHQPTGTVSPTCQSESGICKGVPAGYESDDSWGCHSSTANPEDEIPDLEEELLPFLTLRAWRNHPNHPHRNTQRGRPRGRGRIHHHRQQNQNIPVRDGYDQPPRLWESRPYG